LARGASAFFITLVKARAILDPIAPSAKAVTRQPLAEAAMPAMSGASDQAAVRPRTLVVGRLQGLRTPESLDAFLDVTWSTPEEAPALLAARAIEVVLLDGSLPGGVLRPTLEALGTAHARPAMLLVTLLGRRGPVDAALVDQADDVVNGSLGEEELLSRVRAALRVRGVLAELSRKNAELEALYARLEAMAGRMAAELQLASQVQRSLLPPPLQHPKLDVAREYIPMSEIGGDYYDLILLGEDRVALAIGDVMGKGVPAALLAANLKACLRAQMQGGDVVPTELIARVNRLFWEVTPKGLFASLFFGLLDLRRGVFEYVNAGHDHPFVVRGNGNLQDLDTGGTVLGLLEDARYERGEVVLRRDDLLVFYSDGLTDRANAEGEMYGVDRLKQAARASRGDLSRIALYTLLGEVQGWSAGLPAEDDMTLIVAKLR
jgi:serine phosphatase RsbU (regulator of sigma subunit)